MNNKVILEGNKEMNIKQIKENNTFLHFSHQDGGVIAYGESMAKVVVHSYRKDGACYNGSYFDIEQTQAIKDEFISRVTNDMLYIAND